MDEPKYPDHIQQRITNEFLFTFKEELDKETEQYKKENPTYFNFYQWFDGSSCFYDALVSTCKIHNFMELFYYLQNVGVYFNDSLAYELTEMLYKQGIIAKGSQDDIYPIPWQQDIVSYGH